MIAFEKGTTVVVNSTKYSPFIVKGDAVISELSEGSYHITVYAKYTANTVTSYDNSEVYFTIDPNSKTSSIPEFPSWTAVPTVCSNTGNNNCETETQKRKTTKSY